jgi:hypothetical protein
MRLEVFHSRAGRLLLASLATLLLVQAASAQTRFTYSKGQSVSPAYEGWWPNEDGSFTMFFGYMNTNWLEEFDVPIGPDNNIEPEGPDQGQPTHFYPRRNPFLFTIRLPKDFANKELIWTLTTNGKTEHAYASLKTDYQIDKQVISTEVGGDGGSLRDELRYNIPPTLEVEGDARRSVRVGDPLTLVAVASDPDNLPARRDGKPQPGGRGHSSEGRGQPSEGRGQPSEGRGQPSEGRGQPSEGRGQPSEGRGQSSQGRGQPSEGGQPTPPRAGQPGLANPANLVYRPPSSIVPSNGPGLRLSWIVYRGNAATVAFSPEQMKTWTDTRAYANSPWSPPYIIPEPPPDGKWVVRATFQQPGTYVLRAVASDGALFTYENVTVSVTR